MQQVDKHRRNGHQLVTVEPEKDVAASKRGSNRVSAVKDVLNAAQATMWQSNNRCDKDSKGAPQKQEGLMS